MIKELHIHSFQSHKHTELEFSPGVNLIVGPSDSGKSSIMRALRWVIWNRPGGDAFISNWSDSCFVNVVTAEQDVVQRLKSPKENQYRIDDKVFKAFGSDVPPDVQQVLNIDETNLQQQLDSPFLLTDSPGEVARYFNRVANLEKIDTAIQYVQRQIKSLTESEKADVAHSAELQESLERYAHIPKFEVQLEVVEELEKTLDNKTKKSTQLRSIITQLQEVESCLKGQHETLRHKKTVDHIFDLREQREALQNKINELQDVVDDITGLEEKANWWGRHSHLSEDLDFILSLYERQKQTESKHSALNILYEALLHADKRSKQLEESIDNLNTLFQLEMPEICPLCGNETDGKIKLSEKR